MSRIRLFALRESWRLRNGCLQVATKRWPWMRKAKKRFEGETPMQMLQTEAGARLVEQMLLQLDEGMFA